MDPLTQFFRVHEKKYTVMIFSPVSSIIPKFFLVIIRILLWVWYKICIKNAFVKFWFIFTNSFVVNHICKNPISIKLWTQLRWTLSLYDFANSYWYMTCVIFATCFTYWLSDMFYLLTYRLVLPTDLPTYFTYWLTNLFYLLTYRLVLPTDLPTYSCQGIP